MKVSSEYIEGKLTLLLTGELDHHAAGVAMNELASKIDMHLPRDLVLDLKHLNFMDSSGIALILRAYKKMAELDGSFRVDNVQPQPLRVLGASGIERMVEINKGKKGERNENNKLHKG